MSDILQEHIKKSINQGFRFDGRDLLDFREIVVERGVSKNAEGSARVKIGDTEVIVGVKLSIEKPYPDVPNEGTLMVGVELLPMSSPDFESGPPDAESIEIARVVDRGIRESKAIDTEKLCITAGEKAWTVMIDICTINNDGNLLGASALAAVAALMDTRMPATDEKGAINYKEKTDKMLPINRLPVTVTVYRVGDKLILDPTCDEEKAVSNQLTVAATKEGLICALQKAGVQPFSLAEVEQMVDIAIAKGKELHKLLGR